MSDRDPKKTHKILFIHQVTISFQILCKRGGGFSERLGISSNTIGCKKSIQIDEASCVVIHKEEEIIIIIRSIILVRSIMTDQPHQQQQEIVDDRVRNIMNETMKQEEQQQQTNTSATSPPSTSSHDEVHQQQQSDPSQKYHPIACMYIVLQCSTNHEWSERIVC